MLGRKVIYVRYINCLYNNVAKGIRLLDKKAFMFIQEKNHASKSFWKIYLLNTIWNLKMEKEHTNNKTHRHMPHPPPPPKKRKMRASSKTNWGFICAYLSKVVLLLCFVDLSYDICSLRPCDYLLSNSWPLGSLIFVFSGVFVTFTYGVLGQVWYLNVSLPGVLLNVYNVQ